MAIQIINTGTSANAGNGDSIRTAFNKVNNNFDFLNGIVLGTSTNFNSGVRDVVKPMLVHDAHQGLIAAYSTLNDRIILTVGENADSTFNNIRVLNTATLRDVVMTGTVTMGFVQGFDDVNIIKYAQDGSLNFRMKNTYGLGSSEINMLDEVDGSFNIVHQNSGANNGFFGAGQNYIFDDLGRGINIGRNSNINFYAQQDWNGYTSPALSITSTGTILANSALYLNSSTFYLDNTSVNISETDITINGSPLFRTLPSTSYTAIVTPVGSTAFSNNTPLSTGGSIDLNAGKINIDYPKQFNFLTNDYTVEWFYYGQAPEYVENTIFNYGDPGNPELTAYYSSATFYVKSKGDVVLSAPLSFPYLFTWIHIAIERQSGILTLYIDGTSVDSTENLDNISTSTVLTIGDRFPEDNPPEFKFTGFVTNFRIAKSAIYSGNFTVSTSSLTTSTGTTILLLATNSSTYLVDSSNSSVSLPLRTEVKFSNKIWTFDTDSVITLPYNGDIVNFDGVSVLGGALDTYTPTTPINWIGSPTVATFTAGLDELASRMITVEGNTGGFETTSTLVNGTYTVALSTIGTLTAPGHILPAANLTYDLGSTSSQWRSIHVGTGTIYIGGVALGVNADNYVTVDGNPIITVNTAGNMTIQGDTNIVLGSVAISETAPAATTPGSQWFDTVEGRTYVATGGVWLDASPTQIPSPETYLDGLAIDGTVIGTANVNGDAIVIDGGDNTKLTVSNNSVTIQVPGSLTRPYWAAEFGGITTAVTTSSYTVGTGAFYDSVGNVYVLGAVIFGDGINDIDSLLLKYDTNGNLLWSRTWHDNSGNNCGAVNQAFAIDSNDRIYWLATDLTGYSCWTGYMDTDGNLGLGGIAQGSLGFVGGYVSAVDIACDNSGNYYLAGRYSDGNGNDSPVVIKVDGDNGAPIWTGNIIPEDFEDLPADGQYRAVTVNPATGDVWAIGDYNDGGLRAMLSKWDINGTHQWTKELVTVTGDVASAVIYNGGYVYTIVNDDPDQKAVVSKFDTDGVMIWASFLAVGALDPIPNEFGGPNTGAYDLSFDTAGNVYVTGTIPGPPAGQSQLWITKLDPVTGEMLYSRMLATNDGLSVIDQGAFGGSSNGHRVGDIYQDTIVVTAITQSDIDDNTSTNEFRVMVAQLPIDGSVTGTFDNIDIVDLTGDIDGISSTGTYTVTTLVWSTGTSTAIYSTSSISVSTVTDVVGLTGETIALGSGTAGGSTTTNTWTFVNNNIILPIGGDILDSNGVSVLGATTSTYIEYTDTATDYTSTLDLTYDFNVDVDDAHLDINGNGYWSIGSNNFDTKIFSTDDPGNEPKVIIVRADNDDWTFGPLGLLTLPGGSVISDTTGALRLEPTGASSATQALLIYPTVIDGNHIHLTAGGGETDLYLGNDSQYVKVDHSGTVVVGTLGATTSTWTFGTDGVLTLSTASVILGNSTDPNVYIETATTATTNTWTFAADGTTTFPDGTTSTGAVIRAAQSSSYIIQTLGSAEASPSNVLSTFEFGVDGSLTLPGNIRSDNNINIVAATGAATAIANWIGQGGWDQSSYINTATTGGSGTGLTVDVAAGGAGYINTGTITINNPGTGYTDGDVITINNENNLPGTFTISVPTPTWTFDTDGGVTFPDATVQTTAYVAANVVNKTSGSWTLSTGSNTVSITVAPGGNYQMWVNGNIPNGIVTWNATVSTSNTNVPVVGVQYGWYYAAGNALVLTSMPNQIVGTAGSISTATVATTSSNVFTFGITNNSTSSQVINWGYTTL